MNYKHMCSSSYTKLYLQWSDEEYRRKNEQLEQRLEMFLIWKGKIQTHSDRRCFWRRVPDFRMILSLLLENLH